MRVLLDTCVLSEIRKPNGSQRVKKVVSDTQNENLFISVISIGEIVKGIELLDAGNRKTTLQQWISNLESGYRQAILEIDSETARIWGEITATLQKDGKTLPVCDGLIAATARRHNLKILTRNVSDFECTGAVIIDPWNIENR